MSHELHQRIRERAYELWAINGYPDGRDHEHWCMAEREVVAAAHVPASKKKKAAPAKMPAGAMARQRRGKNAQIHLS